MLQWWHFIGSGRHYRIKRRTRNAFKGFSLCGQHVLALLLTPATGCYHVTNATLRTGEKPQAATWINCSDWFALNVTDRGPIQFPFLLKGSPLPSCFLLALYQTGSVKTNSTDLGSVPAGAQH